MKCSVPDLTDREAHVWLVPLVADENAASGTGLGSEELERANSFRSAADRDAYIARRVALRAILAGYTSKSAEELTFHRSRSGRESLAEPARSRLDFSSSSSGATALIAVARGVKIGVDIEQRKTGLPYLQLAEFTFGMATQIEMTRARDPVGEFLRAWTTLEARIKLIGSGLATTLDEGNARSLVNMPGYLAPLEAGTDYEACLAASSELSALRTFQYDRWTLNA